MLVSQAAPTGPLELFLRGAAWSSAATAQGFCSLRLATHHDDEKSYSVSVRCCYKLLLPLLKPVIVPRSEYSSTASTCRSASREQRARPADSFPSCGCTHFFRTRSFAMMLPVPCCPSRTFLLASSFLSPLLLNCLRAFYNPLSLSGRVHP